MNMEKMQNKEYVSPSVEVMNFNLEMFTGSVLGGSMGIQDWDNEPFPDATL